MNEPIQIGDIVTLRLSEFLMKACGHFVKKHVNPRVGVNVWDGFLENLAQAKIEEIGVPKEVTGRGLGEFLGILKKPRTRRISKCS